MPGILRQREQTSILQPTSVIGGLVVLTSAPLKVLACMPQLLGGAGLGVKDGDNGLFWNRVFREGLGLGSREL